MPLFYIFSSDSCLWSRMKSYCHSISSHAAFRIERYVNMCHLCNMKHVLRLVSLSIFCSFNTCVILCLLLNTILVSIQTLNKCEMQLKSRTSEDLVGFLSSSLGDFTLTFLLESQRPYSMKQQMLSPRAKQLPCYLLHGCVLILLQAPQGTSSWSIVCSSPDACGGIGLMPPPVRVDPGCVQSW